MSPTLIATQTAIVLSVAIALALLSLGLRLWSRSLRKAPLRFNDYIIIVAMMLAMGVYGNALVGVGLNVIGIHMSDIVSTRPWVVIPYLKSFVAAEVLWSCANTCVKFSILSLYTVLFPTKMFSRICYTVMGVTVIYLISVLVEAFALCKPVAYTWDKSIMGGTCEGQDRAFLAAGIMNLILDAITVMLPMPMLFGLQMSLGKRFSIAGMFSLGVIICVLSLLRIIWLVNLNLVDLTYGVGDGTIYSALEPILGIVNACLPIIKPSLDCIVRNKYPISMIQKILGSDSNTQNPSSNAAGSHRRLDDHIPLTSIHVQSDGNIEDSSNITVTHEWQVNSYQGNDNTKFRGLGIEE